MYYDSHIKLNLGIVMNRYAIVLLTFLFSTLANANCFQKECPVWISFNSNLMMLRVFVNGVPELLPNHRFTSRRPMSCLPRHSLIPGGYDCTPSSFAVDRKLFRVSPVNKYIVINDKLNIKKENKLFITSNLIITSASSTISKSLGKSWIYSAGNYIYVSKETETFLHDLVRHYGRENTWINMK